MADVYIIFFKNLNAKFKDLQAINDLCKILCENIEFNMTFLFIDFAQQTNKIDRILFEQTWSGRYECAM